MVVPLSEAQRRYKLKNKKIIAERNAIWYQKNMDRHKKRNREYYKKNAERIKKRNRLHRLTNREEHLEYAKARRLKQKRVVIDHYSKGKNECKCCGEKEFNFLTLDHINNDGNRDRVKSKNNLHSYLIRNNFPKGIRVMCFNCNSGRELSPGKICPHKRKKK